MFTFLQKQGDGSRNVITKAIIELSTAIIIQFVSDKKREFLSWRFFILLTNNPGHHSENVAPMRINSFINIYDHCWGQRSPKSGPRHFLTPELFASEKNQRKDDKYHSFIIYLNSHVILFFIYVHNRIK